jgi:hypothetical protein
MGIRSSNLGVFPTFGAGYRIIDALRIGLTLEWGIIAANNLTMAGAVGGTSPATDVLVHTTAQDWFVPAFTASVHLVPLDAIDLVLAFRYQDDFEAPGRMNVTTGLHDPLFETATTKNIRLGSVEQSFPWKLRAGVRYSDRLAPRSVGTGRGESDLAYDEPIHDPLEDERWDVEVDLEYQINSRNDSQVVSYADVRLVDFVPENPQSAPMQVELPHPMGEQHTIVEKHWKDQVSVRLGGTYNPLPGLLGISAGAHYETRGVTPAFMQTDFWPVARLGLHAGVTVRVAGAIDLVVAYAHIFQETIVVAPPPHRAREEIDLERRTTGRLHGIDKTVGAPLDRSGAGTVVLQEPEQGAPDGVAALDQNLNRVASDQPPWIVNAGRYRSSYDILSVGVNVHF